MDTNHALDIISHMVHIEAMIETNIVLDKLFFVASYKQISCNITSKIYILDDHDHVH